VVSSFDLAEEVPPPNLFEADMELVDGTSSDLSSRKEDRAGTFFKAAED